MKRTILLFSIIVIFGTMLNIPSSQVNSAVQNQGTFVNEVSNWNPYNLDPATNYNTAGTGIIQLVYERLIQFANNSLNTITDSLAYTNYTIDSSGTTYTFWLKPGITFALQAGETVGQPFNAYVMQYSLDRAIIMNDPQGPTPYTIGPWIVGGNSVSANSALNVTTANNFLQLQSIKALSMYKLQITINRPFLGFIQTLQSTAASAISPKAIIDNEPSAYTTDISNTQFGMVPLTYFFPGMSNATILSNLGLPSNYNLGNSGVVPYSPANAGSPNEYTWTNSHSAGTGAWIIQSNSASVGAKIIINSNWWNINSLPSTNQITTVTWNQETSTNTRIQELVNGTADSVEIPFSSLNQVIDLATKQPIVSNLQVNTIDSLDNDFLGFDMASTLPSSVISENSSSNYSIGYKNYTKLLQYSWNNATGYKQYASPGNPFTSLLFRKAFAYAFNYDLYINKSLDGFAIRMQGAIPKGLLGYDGNLISNGYIPSTNLTIAKDLFNQVGFKGTISLYYNIGSYSRQIALTLLKQSIESLNVGISISVVSVSWQQYLSYVFNSQVAMFQLGWTPDYPDAHDYMIPYYANAANGGFFSSIGKYDNPYVNELITQGISATTNAQRTSIYTQLEENATQDYPYIYLDQQQNVLVTGNWIHGLNDPTTNSLNPWSIYPSYQYLTKTTPTTGTTISIFPSTSTTTSTTTSTNTTTPIPTSTTETNTTSTNMTSTSTTSTSSSSSSIIPSSITKSKTLTTSPGFEVVTLVISTTFLVLVSIQRKKSTKK